MNKKIIVIFIIGIMIIAGLLTLIPSNSHLKNENISQNKTQIYQENIYRYNNQNIIEFIMNNKSYYFYDNNMTYIGNNLALINNYILIYSDSAGIQNLYFDFTSNINTANLPLIKGYSNIQNGAFFIKTYEYNTSSNFNFTTYNGMSGTTGNSLISYNLNSINIIFQSNIYYYFTNTTKPYLVPVQSKFILSSPSLYGISGANITINNEIIFNNINGYYSTTINNYYKNGNITITNNSGYSLSQKLNIGTSLNLLLQNGSYQYSFSFTNSTGTFYINKSFNISGNTVILNINGIKTNSELFFIIFAIFNLFLIITIFLLTKNYLTIIPIQALFLIVGYEIGIMYYQFYLIAIFVLFISLYISFEIMNRIGD